MLSTPPAFVLSQNQTLQTKTPQPNEAVIKSEKPDIIRKTDNKNTTSIDTGRQEHGQNKNNKQKPPNTLLSSQTTHPFHPRDQHAAQSRVLVVRTFGNPPKWNFPLGRRRAQRLGRVATTSTSYVREKSESNGLIGGVSQLFRRSCALACVSPDWSCNALHPGDIPLAPTEHQPPVVEKV